MKSEFDSGGNSGIQSRYLSSYLMSVSIKIRICETEILPIVLNEHETWFLVLREEYRLRMFENRVLREEGQVK
jgi:hypothetical protein